MGGVKAKLSVVLRADDLVIAESEDEQLWRVTFEAISAGRVSAPVPTPKSVPESAEKAAFHSDQGGPLNQFAAELELTAEVVAGACSPSDEPPFLHMNHHCWEAFRKNTAARGRTAIPPTVLVGTVLALWFRTLGVAAPSISQIHQVLQTLSLQDRNAPRALRNCGWLTLRSNDAVALNPAEISRALGVARAFCSKQPIA